MQSLNFSNNHYLSAFRTFCQGFHTNFGASVNLTTFVTTFCTFQNNLIFTEYISVRFLGFGIDILINCWLLWVSLGLKVNEDKLVEVRTYFSPVFDYNFIAEILDIFISYSSGSKPFIQNIAPSLKTVTFTNIMSMNFMLIYKNAFSFRLSFYSLKGLGAVIAFRIFRA